MSESNIETQTKEAVMAELTKIKTMPTLPLQVEIDGNNRIVNIPPANTLTFADMILFYAIGLRFLPVRRNGSLGDLG